METTPLGRVLAGICKSIHEDLYDVLDAADRDLANDSRRSKLQQGTVRAALVLVKTLVLVKWTKTAAKDIVGIKCALDVLSTDQQRWSEWKGCEQVVDRLMFPVWDISGAVHVDGSGGYRLLPRVLEMGWNKPLEQGWVTCATGRLLNDHVGVRLVRELLVYGKCKWRVIEDVDEMGEAKLLGDGAWVKVSLRMRNRPAAEEGVELNPEERMIWRVSEIKFTLKSAELSGINLVNKNQCKGILMVLNEMLFKHPAMKKRNDSEYGLITPLDMLYGFLVSFSTNIRLEFYRTQIGSLIAKYPSIFCSNTKDGFSIFYWNKQYSFEIRRVSTSKLPKGLILEHSDSEISDSIQFININSDVIDLIAIFEKILAVHSRTILRNLKSNLEKSDQRLWTLLHFDQVSHVFNDEALYTLQIVLFASTAILVRIDINLGHFKVIMEGTRSDHSIDFDLNLSFLQASFQRLDVGLKDFDKVLPRMYPILEALRTQAILKYFGIAANFSGMLHSQTGSSAMMITIESRSLKISIARCASPILMECCVDDKKITESKSITVSSVQEENLLESHSKQENLLDAPFSSLPLLRALAF